MIQIITNSQRNYFGLQEIDPSWKEIVVQSENFNDFNVVIYVDDKIVKKCIIFGEKKYKEMQLNEELTDNLSEIIREDGKTSSLDSIINKSAKKVTISFDAPNISIYNASSKKTFYSNFFENKANLNNLSDFKKWVNKWCETMPNEDIADIIKFSGEDHPENVNYKEGDVFRVKLSRDVYGYGKILLTYKSMRENGEKYWESVMGTPVIASLYHILTENKNMTVQELEKLKSFPSELVMDTNFVTGEYEIIGSTTVDEKTADFPYMYGRELSKPKTTFFQHGRTFIKLDGVDPLYNSYKYCGVLSNIGLNLDLMKKCIEDGSNLAYFEFGPVYTKSDLRNPKNKLKLEEIKKQLGIN